MLVIGLTGSKAGGKGEVSEFLKNRRFIYYSLSDMVREEAKKRGLENYTIKDLQDIGNDLRSKDGFGILAKMVIDKINVDIKQGKDKFVIDGIRNPGEIDELRKLACFHLVSVGAPQEKRFEWLLKRARVSDPKTWQEFLKMDARDKGDGELKIGQQVSLCMNTADFKIMNDSTIALLHEKIKEILISL
jgi:dephospho-CoA kinase